MTENIEKIINSCGAELYDSETVTENEKKIFRIYITYKDGVTLDKCEEISRILSPIFDLTPPVSGEYFFEVSSPGIERNLKTPKHFIASIGELAKITLINKDKLQGKIINADENALEIEDNGTHKVPYSDILKARTYFEW
ncbi:MAG: ribosome maturation factor RimP [Campylobacteraceae bacterium]